MTSELGTEIIEAYCKDRIPKAIEAHDLPPHSYQAIREIVCELVAQMDGVMADMQKSIVAVTEDNKRMMARIRMYEHAMWGPP